MVKNLPAPDHCPDGMELTVLMRHFVIKNSRKSYPIGWEFNIHFRIMETVFTVGAVTRS